MGRTANSARRIQHTAPIFAALGDETRLALVGRLVDASPQSITQLTEGSGITRQAVTKHLRVLEGAGLVASSPRGRESLYALRKEPLDEVRRYLDEVSRQWDDALARLKAFVED